MLLTDYRIETEGYAGPLDLLLYLTRRSEVDICTMSLSRITADFITYIEVLDFLDFDLIGDFVVVASTLLEIKSRNVLPAAAEAVDEETPDDSGSDLIAKLLEYRRYREAARKLEERASEWMERYPRLSTHRPSVVRDRSEDRIREVELWDLVSALSRIVHIPQLEREAVIRLDETPIGVWQEMIRDRIRAEGRAAFSSFFSGEKVQSRIAGIFLAILELIRHESYRGEQPVDYGEIWILPPRADDPLRRGIMDQAAASTVSAAHTPGSQSPY
jgi:segregation and condensation protein A